MVAASNVLPQSGGIPVTGVVLVVGVFLAAGYVLRRRTTSGAPRLPRIYRLTDLALDHERIPDARAILLFPRLGF
jgi:hypothetical protein